MLKGKETIHFNADASNTELLFRIIQSVHPLSIHGAVSNWCEQSGLRTDEKEQERILEKKRIREQRNTEEREFTRSELFGVFSKTSIWKQIAGKHSRIRTAVRDFNLPRFANLHRSSTGYRLVRDSRPNLTRTTVLEISSQYAENTHFLEETQVPELMQQFLEKQLLDQSLKFTSYKYLVPMDLKSTFNLQIPSRRK